MKTVWITGGSRGIGVACVRAFAAEGWQVAFTYRSSAEHAQRLTEEHAHVFALQGDMTVKADVERCFDLARQTFGRPDALVCNVGIAQQKMFCDLTDTDWNNMLNANLMSAVYAMQSALPDFVHQKAGSIVTVSSVWGVTGASCESHYAASKAALIGLTKSLAQELGPSGIRVNCVAPGVIDTDMNAAHSDETMRQLADETPLGRTGKAEEVAQSIVYLCSDKASFVTGQTLAVTGGFCV